MNRLVLILLLISTLKIQAQQTENSNIYLMDFDYFIENLIATHPDPFTAFGNEIGFYGEKQKIKEEIKKISTDDEFVFILNKFVSRLEDGHTFINKSSKSKNSEVKNLPVSFKVASDKLFVQNTTKEYKSLIGKPVVSINNIPIDSLLAKVKLYYPTENISGSYFNLINILKSNVSAQEFFDDNLNTLKLTFKGADSVQSVVISYVDTLNWLTQESSVTIPNQNGWINCSMIGKDKKIAYFQWNSMVSRELLEHIVQENPKNIEGSLQWIYGGMLRDKRTGDVKKDINQIPAVYEQFYLMLQEMKVKGSKYLIIDLRNNNGGYTSLTEPLLYILFGEKYLNFDFNAEYIVKMSPLFLRKYGITIDQYNNSNNTDYMIGDYISSDFGNIQGNSHAEKVEHVENGYYGFGKDFVRKSINLNCKPQIVILTSINTFSAAYHFTYFLKRIGNTKIIGVAPRQAGNSFMESTPFELPNTKITGSISNSVQILYKKDTETGKLLHPDFEMTWKEFSEYQFNKDAEVLKAIELIETEKINTR
ncbi:MAG: S41 family peptidase [Lentimicrobiaceae bacterium]|nr:S41 family peptidase [Lentimicrobiaceae bacterium]